MKGFKNDGSLAKALSCKVEFIYSARKIVHSEEYIKRENKPESIPTMICSGNKQVSTIYERGLGFAEAPQ